MNLPNSKTPAESVVIEFDFGAELTAITSATVTIRALGVDTDPLAAQVLIGPHQVVGARVLQRVGGGVSRVDYELVCIATYGSDIRELAGTMKVRPAA
jgi:hypothetical protein